MNHRLVAKYNGVYYVVKYEDILFFERKTRMIEIVKRDGGIVVYYNTFDSLLEHLPSTMFAQCHRSFIVNMDAINHIQSNTIYFDSIRGTIPIGRMYGEPFHRNLSEGDC